MELKAHSFPHPQHLSDKEQVLVVQHGSYHDPSWMVQSELHKHPTYDYSYYKQHLFYLEPANISIDFENKLDIDSLQIAVIRKTGQFYSEQGYPLRFSATKEIPGPARVFRYTKMEILRGGIK